MPLRSRGGFLGVKAELCERKQLLFCVRAGISEARRNLPTMALQIVLRLCWWPVAIRPVLTVVWDWVPVPGLVR